MVIIAVGVSSFLNKYQIYINHELHSSAIYELYKKPLELRLWNIDTILGYHLRPIQGGFRVQTPFFIQVCLVFIDEVLNDTKNSDAMSLELPVLKEKTQLEVRASFLPCNVNPVEL